MFYADTSIVVAYYCAEEKSHDALHLAIAFSKNIPIVTSDINLAKSAEALGVPVKLI